MSSSSPRLLALALVVTALLVTACSSGGGPSADSWNDARAGRGFDRAANREALAVLDRISTAGLPCTARQTESFDVLAVSYQKVHLPVPFGSASCTGPGGENLLVEVFPHGRYPSGADFMRRKAALVCAKSRKLGRKPDGTNDFEGVPFVMAKNRVWVIEPDSFPVNRQLAKALGLPARNACPELKGKSAPNK